MVLDEKLNVGKNNSKTKVDMSTAREYNEYTKAEPEQILRYKKFDRTVHVWIINTEKELLLQRRNCRTLTHSNQWDIAIENDLKEGEGVIAGAIRIAKKSLGIDIVEEDLEYITTIKRKNYRSGMEVRYIYIMRCNMPLEQYKYKPKNMSGLRYISYKKLESMVKHRDPTILKHYREYRALFGYIRNFLE